MLKSGVPARLAGGGRDAASDPAKGYADTTEQPNSLHAVAQKAMHVTLSPPLPHESGLGCTTGYAAPTL